MTTAAGRIEAGEHRRIWMMAGPIILSNISVPLLGAVDTAVMGHLPNAYYLGAVGVGAMLFNFVYMGFICLRMASTGLTAQARGAEDFTEARAVLGRGLLLGAAISVVLMLLQRPIVDLAFWLIDSSAQVETLGREYFLIRVWAVPAALGTFAIIGWFYGLLDARIPLVLQIFTNSLNVILDLVFVYEFGWDVDGVATASVIAEYSGLALGVFFVLRRLRRMPEAKGKVRLFDIPKLKRLLQVNTDIFLRSLCVVGSFALFTGQSAALGDITLAANQVLINFLQFSTFGLDGFAYAAETLAGGAVGARNANRFRSAVRACFLWAGIVAALNVLVYALLGVGIVDLLTSIPDVREAAYAFLPWAVVMPAIAVWAYTYDGVFMGAVRTRVMRNTMMLAFAAYVAALAVLVPAFGNTGLWIAMAVFLGSRGLLLGTLYPRLARSIGS